MTSIKKSNKIKIFLPLTLISASIVALSSIVALVSANSASDAPGQTNVYLTVLSTLYLLAFPILYVFTPLLVHALSVKNNEKSGTQIVLDVLSSIAIITLLLCTNGLVTLLMGPPSTSSNDAAGFAVFFFFLPIAAIASTFLIVSTIMTLVRWKKNGVALTAKVINITSLASLLTYWAVLIAWYAGAFIK